jgi:Zn-dependent protease with chaperone function
VARSQVPYPPSPKRVPPELLELGEQSTAQVVGVLVGLFLFLAVYLGLILTPLIILVLMVVLRPPVVVTMAGVIGIVITGVVSLILILGLFSRTGKERNAQVEIDEDSQPIFFAFLRRLTDEIGAPMPHRVFITPDVNAAMMRDLSIINLIIPPKKNLVVGCGLINSLNLSEFKAVMAHEFGHFSQKTTRLSAYIYVALMAMEKVIAGPDWLNAWLKEVRRQSHGDNDDGVAFAGLFAIVVGGPVWMVSQIMSAIYHLVVYSSLSLSRKQEFHADRIAVSVAGSNAIVHSLYRAEFAVESLEQAVQDLETASQHKLFTRDLYLHHTAAAERIRRQRKRPDLGLPPKLKGPDDGEDLRLFDPNEENPVPEMWATHPKDFDREESAKEIFVPAEIDERSPWTLFTDADLLREQVTYKFYRAAFRVKRDVELSRAKQVQEFIDEEYAEITYDPKYHGCYDERPIWPGSIAELNKEIDREPWAPTRIAHAHSRLYRELGNKVEDLAYIRKAIRKIYRKSYGRPRGRDRDRLEDLEHDFEKLTDWFASFDRRVYLVHIQMARKLDRELFDELVHRYKFHLEIQEIHAIIARAQDEVLDVLEGLEQEDTVLPPDFFEEVRHRFKLARNALRDCLARAGELRTPEMANIPAGRRLDRLIFDREVLREPGEYSIRGAWVNKLLTQLAVMRHRVNRLDFKSLGAILQMQDRLAADWHARIKAEEANPDLLPEVIAVEEPPEPQPIEREADNWRE